MITITLLALLMLLLAVGVLLYGVYLETNIDFPSAPARNPATSPRAGTL